MDAAAITLDVERLHGGILRATFIGRGGIGSEGNEDGARMRALLREAISKSSPTGLVIDLTSFDYRFGNWIGSVPIEALGRLGKGRICIVANGSTADALRPMWEVTKWNLVVPIFDDIQKAIAFLT